jgi:hypothetical protein
MAIEIYSYDISKPLVLHAVAPLEQKEQVEIWCSNMNEEAEAAGVTRRYKYDITTVEIW